MASPIQSLSIAKSMNRTNKRESTGLLSLPSDLLEVILQKLDKEDLRNLSSTCRQSHALCQPKLWHTIGMRGDFDGSWRDDSITVFNSLLSQARKAKIGEESKMASVRSLNLRLDGATTFPGLRTYLDRSMVTPPRMRAIAMLDGLCDRLTHLKVVCHYNEGGSPGYRRQRLVDNVEAFTTRCYNESFSLPNLTTLEVDLPYLARVLLPFTPNVRSLLMVNCCLSPQSRPRPDDPPVLYHRCWSSPTPCDCAQSFVHLRYGPFHPLRKLLQLRFLTLKILPTDLTYMAEWSNFDGILEEICKAASRLHTLIVHGQLEDMPRSLLEHKTVRVVEAEGTTGLGGFPNLKRLCTAGGVAAQGYATEVLFTPGVALKTLEDMIVNLKVGERAECHHVRPNETTSYAISSPVLRKLARNPSLNTVYIRVKHDDMATPRYVFRHPSTWLEKQVPGFLIRTYRSEWDESFTHIRLLPPNLQDPRPVQPKEKPTSPKTQSVGVISDGLSLPLLLGLNLDGIKRARETRIAREGPIWPRLERMKWCHYSSFAGEAMPLHILKRLYLAMDESMDWFESGRGLTMSEEAWRVLREWRDR